MPHYSLGKISKPLHPESLSYFSHTHADSPMESYLMSLLHYSSVKELESGK